MAKVKFHSEQLHHTKGTNEIDIPAVNYRCLIKEILTRYPGFSEAELNSYIVKIDGVIVQTPFLEEFNNESEIIFIKKVAAG